MDSAKREIIYAHCVAPTKVFGPSGPASRWHRVTFYGDLKEPVSALAQATGWKVVTET